MQKVMSITSICPLLKEPSYQHEMISQLLFGEQAELLEETETFARIKCLNDNYEGWCLNNQLAKINPASVFILKGFINKPSAVAFLNNSPVQLPLATPVYENIDNGHYKLHYPHNNFLPVEGIATNSVTALEIAMSFLNTAYIWGGKSSYGIDCSGLTQQIMKLMGITLPRDAYQQVTKGETVDFLQAAHCGDLAFFDNEAGEIIHVGMLLDNNTIIHASGYVKIDAIDNFGITNSITGKRSHRLRIIKRFF